MVLDAGDALFPSPGKPDDRALAHARFIASEMGALRTAAMAVGERDLSAGVDWLLEQAKEAKVPLVSANLQRQDGSHPFAPSVLVKAGADQVGIIGLHVPAGPGPGGLVATDPVAAAKAEVAKLKEKGADVIVALVHGRSADGRSVAGVEGIDFLIPSHEGQMALPYQPVPGHAWFIGAGARGRQVELVEVWPKGTGPMQDAGAGARYASERAYVEARLVDAKRRLEKAEPDAKAGLEKMIASLQGRIGELDQKIASAGGVSGRRFQAQEISLGKEVADQPQVAERLAELQKKWPGSPEAPAPMRATPP